MRVVVEEVAEVHLVDGVGDALLRGAPLREADAAPLARDEALLAERVRDRALRRGQAVDRVEEHRASRLGGEIGERAGERAPRARGVRLLAGEERDDRLRAAREPREQAP